jgi:hypothetical protein
MRLSEPLAMDSKVDKADEQADEQADELREAR